MSRHLTIFYRGKEKVSLTSVETGHALSQN